MSIYRDLMNQTDPGDSRSRSPQFETDFDSIERKLIPLLDHLLQAQSLHSRKVFGFSGLHGSEGVTSLLVEFTRLLASRGIQSNTLLIDANWQSPELSRKYATGGKHHLLSVMRGDSTISEAVISGIVPGVDFLPGGSADQLTGFDVTSGQLQTELFQARKAYDLVLVDMIPMCHPESIPLMRLLDGIFLVLEADRTKHSSGQNSVERLRSAGIQVEGVLFNKRQRKIPQFIYSRL